MLPPPPVPPAMLRPRIETYDDRHVIAKHEAIVPKPDELATLNQSVDSVEKVSNLGRLFRNLERPNTHGPTEK